MVENWRNDYLRALPAVDAVVAAFQSAYSAYDYAHTLLVQVAQEVVAQLRRQILAAAGAEQLADLDFSAAAAAAAVKARLTLLQQPSLRRVINATGTVLHTNLGRAPLAAAARAAVAEAASYCNLEVDLATGKRGSRHAHVEALLQRLTGAEAACVVNNNAAAVLVALNTLAAGKEVIVSRGELVEIGGSFRIPEVMAAGGARLVEVGTTNKTHLRDYQRAIGEETALLLKVHTSNYQVVGFTAAVETAALVKLARETGLPVMEDLGSGLLLDLSPYGLAREPLVTDCVAAGADVVTLSGDKLLGGPQAGIILGKRQYVERIKQNQLLRALRPDKLTLAALEATLQIYLTGSPLKEIPVLAKLTTPAAVLQQRADRLAAAINKGADGLVMAEVREDVSYVGGGAMPTTYLPTCVVAVRSREIPLHRWVEQLRLGTPALVGRVQDDWLLLDLRTIAESEEEEVVRCLTS
jgi:L-seryl-tRNA(Ser) seleniumtransferase